MSRIVIFVHDMYRRFELEQNSIFMNSTREHLQQLFTFLRTNKYDEIRFNRPFTQELQFIEFVLFIESEYKHITELDIQLYDYLRTERVYQDALESIIKACPKLHSIRWHVYAKNEKIDSEQLINCIDDSNSNLVNVDICPALLLSFEDPTRLHAVYKKDTQFITTDIFSYTQIETFKLSAIFPTNTFDILQDQQIERKIRSKTKSAMKR